MEFEAGVVIAVAVTIAALIIDWPRALVGLVLGAIGRFVPYGTVVLPIGIVPIAALGEFVYPAIGRTTEPSLGSFAIGLISVGATASSLYVTIRNLKDRL